MQLDLTWTRTAIDRLEHLYKTARDEKVDVKLKILHELHSIEGLHSGGSLDVAAKPDAPEPVRKPINGDELNAGVSKVLGIPAANVPTTDDPEDRHA